MIYLALLLIPVVPIAGLMAWQWNRREHHIRAAWRRMKSSLDLDASRARIDRCIGLLLSEYGLDTFRRAQIVALNARGAESPSVEYCARLAAERWQITLPPLELRVLNAKGSRFAGTFTSGTTAWSAIVSGEEARR